MCSISGASLISLIPYTDKEVSCTGHLILPEPPAGKQCLGLLFSLSGKQPSPGP